MKIIKFKKAAMEILDFEKQYNLELTVYERDPEAKDLPRYYTHFDSAEIKVGKCCLSGESGNGSTPEQAIKDYCRKISNKTLVIDAMSDTNRRESEVPELQHTRLTLEELFPIKEGLKEKIMEAEIRRLKKMMEPLPTTDPEKLRDTLRQIGEQEATLQPHLERESIDLETAIKKALLSQDVGTPIGESLTARGIREILKAYAAQIERTRQFIILPNTPI